MKHTQRILLRSAFLLLVLLGCGCSRATKIERTLKSACGYYDKMEYPYAEIQFKRVLQLEPKNSQANKGLGMIRMRQGASLDGLRLLSIAKSELPDDVEIGLNMAWSMFDLGFMSDCREETLELLSRFPDNGEALLLLAETSVTPEAMTECEERIASANDQEQATVLLANALIQLRRGHVDSAKAITDTIILKHPDCFRAMAVQGAIHMLEDEPENALADLEKSAELAGPRSPEIGSYAMMLFELNHKQDAIETLKSATRKIPDYLPNWRMLGQMYIAAGNDSMAEESLEYVISKNPLDVKACILRSRIYLRKNAATKAVELMENLSRKCPPSPSVQVSLAQSYFAAGEFCKASETLDRLLLNCHQNAEALLLRAVLHLKNGEYVDVIRSMGKILALDPSDKRAKHVLVRAYLESNRLDDAVILLRKYITETPEDPDFGIQLGNVLASQGKSSEARVTLEHVLKNSPDHPDAMSQLIVLDQKNGKHADAMARADAYLATHPESTRAHMLKAGLCFDQKDLKTAEWLATKTTKLNPQDVAAYDTLARIQISDGRSSEAVKSLEQQIKNDRTNIAARMQISILLQESGRTEESVAALDEIIVMAPDFAPAYNNLACIHSQIPGNIDLALRYARKARSIAPDNPVIADTMGWVEWIRGKYSDALPLLMEAVSAIPYNPTMQYHLAMTYYMMYQVKPAVKGFEKALSADGEFNQRGEAVRRLSILRDGRSYSPEKLLKMVKDDPLDIVPRLLLAQKFQTSGQSENALKCYEESIAINPEIAVAHIGKASIYACSMNQLDKAFDAATIARGIEPQNPSVASILGMINFRIGDHPAAFSLLQEAARILPEDPCVQYDYAWAAYSMGHVDIARAIMHKMVASYPSRKLEARDFLALTDENFVDTSSISHLVENYIDHFPLCAPALMARATLQSRVGESPASSYSEVLKIFPNFAPASLELAKIYLDEPGKHDAAEKIAFELRKEMQNETELKSILSVIYYRRNEFEYAEQMLMEISKDRPLTGIEVYFLGLSYAATKKTVEAKKTMIEALSFDLPVEYATKAMAIIDM